MADNNDLCVIKCCRVVQRCHCHSVVLILGIGKIGIAAATRVNTAAVIEDLPCRHAAGHRRISSQNMTAIRCNDELEKFQMNQRELVPNDGCKKHKRHESVKKNEETSSAEEKQDVEMKANAADAIAPSKPVLNDCSRLHLPYFGIDIGCAPHLARGLRREG